MADAYDTAVLAESGLVTYLALDETVGSIATDAKSALNYTYTGTFTLNTSSVLPGFPASPLANFATGYLTRATSAALHPADTFSYEFWVRIAAYGTTMAFSDMAANEHNLFVDTAGGLNIRKDSVATLFTSTTAFTDIVNPHHIVFTKNGATYHVYYDGVDQAGTNFGNQTMVASTAAPVLLASAGGIGPVLCNVAKIAMYNVALSAGQVLTHYNLGSTVGTPLPPRPTRPYLQAVTRSSRW